MEAEESVNENEADCTYAVYSQIMNQSVNIFVIAQIYQICRLISVY